MHVCASCGVVCAEAVPLPHLEWHEHMPEAIVWPREGRRRRSRACGELPDDVQMVTQVCERIGLDVSLCDQIVRIMTLLRPVVATVWRGERRVALIGACVCLACTAVNVGVHDTEICASLPLTVAPKVLNKQRKLLLRHMHDLGYTHRATKTPRQDVHEYGQRFCGRLGLDRNLTQYVCSRAAALTSRHELESKATVVLLSCVVMDLLSAHVDMEAIARAAHVRVHTLVKWHAACKSVSPHVAVTAPHAADGGVNTNAAAAGPGRAARRQLGGRMLQAASDVDRHDRGVGCVAGRPVEYGVTQRPQQGPREAEQLAAVACRADFERRADHADDVATSSAVSGQVAVDHPRAVAEAHGLRDERHRGRAVHGIGEQHVRVCGGREVCALERGARVRRVQPRNQEVHVAPGDDADVT